MTAPTEHRPQPAEAPARLSAEGQALLRRWIAGRAADLTLGELVALLESGLDDLKTYRAALDQLTDERDEHAMECMRLQSEGAYDVGYQRGAERSKAELDAERERADRAAHNAALQAVVEAADRMAEAIERQFVEPRSISWPQGETAVRDYRSARAAARGTEEAG